MGSAGLPPAFAAKIGRSDAARVEGRGGTGVTRLGQGRVWGQGATAAGLSTEAKLGSASASFSLDTGTLSSLFLAGIVIGVGWFYLWTRSAQA